MDLGLQINNLFSFEFSRSLRDLFIKQLRLVDATYDIKPYFY